MYWRFLVWQLLFIQTLWNNCRSFPSIGVIFVRFFIKYVCFSSDEEIKRNITCWMTATIVSDFCGWNSNFCLLDLLASEHWSPVLIYVCYTSLAEWSAAVTHHSQSDCQMRNHQSILFRIERWKFHQKGINVCSGNLKYFRSITLNPLLPFSISWQYSFKNRILWNLSF
jgi:hypothetical protein